MLGPLDQTPLVPPTRTTPLAGVEPALGSHSVGSPPPSWSPPASPPPPQAATRSSTSTRRMTADSTPGGVNGRDPLATLGRPHVPEGSTPAASTLFPSMMPAG